jgi:hypothetical protein
MVGIDDLVADVKVQVRSTHKKAPGGGRGHSEESSIFTVKILSRNGSGRQGWVGKPIIS